MTFRWTGSREAETVNNRYTTYMHLHVDDKTVYDSMTILRVNVHNEDERVQ